MSAPPVRTPNDSSTTSNIKEEGEQKSSFSFGRCRTRRKPIDRIQVSTNMTTRRLLGSLALNNTTPTIAYQNDNVFIAVSILSFRLKPVQTIEYLSLKEIVVKNVGIQLANNHSRINYIIYSEHFTGQHARFTITIMIINYLHQRVDCVTSL